MWDGDFKNVLNHEKTHRKPVKKQDSKNHASSPIMAKEVIA